MNGEKITIDRAKDHPCYGCKYAMERPKNQLGLFNSWFVCARSIADRKAKIVKLTKNLSEYTEKWLDCLIAGHAGGDEYDKVNNEMVDANVELDTEMDKIYEVMKYGWSNPVPMSDLDPACHSEHELPLFSYSEGQALPLSEDLVPVFGQISAPVCMKSCATQEEAYTFAELGNGWNPKILYAVKDGFYTSEPDDAMSYADVVGYEGRVTVENWKKFWEGRGYKVSYMKKEL